MQENDLKALISLLDDEDPEVATHVWEKLISIGEGGIDRLESEWEVQSNPVIQARIEEVIQTILGQEVTRELLEWRKGGGKNLWDAWCLITKYKYPEADTQFYHNHLNRLVNKTWLEIKPGMHNHEKLRVLNHILFVLEKYKSNKKELHFPEDNFINFVFDRKRGNIVTLSLLYLLICEKLDFPVMGVLIPGYFFLYCTDRGKEFYIDVYNGGLFYTRDHLKKFLKAVNIEEKPAYFKPTSNIYIILRLLRTIINDYKKADKPEDAARFENLLNGIEISF